MLNKLFRQLTNFHWSDGKRKLSVAKAHRKFRQLQRSLTKLKFHQLAATVKAVDEMIEESE